MARSLRRLRRLRPDADRRGLPGGERARDDLRRRPRLGRARASRRRLRLAHLRLLRLPRRGRRRDRGLPAAARSSAGGSASAAAGPFLERHGRFFHLSPATLDRADRWFERWDDWAVFIGRITPVARSFISIPAGVFEMPFRRYNVFTLLGNALWCIVLAGGRLGARAELHEAPPRFSLPGDRRRCRDRADRRVSDRASSPPGYDAHRQCRSPTLTSKRSTHR